MKKYKHEIKRVEWIDSKVMDLYQVNEEDDLTPTKIESVGFVVKEDSEYIVLAREKVSDDWRGVIVIPNVSILKIYDL